MNLLAAASNLIAEGTVNLKPGVGLAGDVQNVTLSQVIGGLLSLILVVAAIVFFFILVVGGIRWIMSGGDKAQTEGARNQITAALVGLVIVFSAWAIANLVGTFFGINIFELSVPSIKDVTSGGI